MRGCPAAGSDFFEAAAGCGKAVSDLLTDGAVNLQLAHALAVRNQTTGDTNFARRAARFEAKRNSNDAFDQGVAAAAKGFDYPSKFAGFASGLRRMTDGIQMKEAARPRGPPSRLIKQPAFAGCDRMSISALQQRILN